MFAWSASPVAPMLRLAARTTRLDPLVALERVVRKEALLVLYELLIDLPSLRGAEPGWSVRSRFWREV